MFKIGCHLSSARGYSAMGKDAQKINATTCQFFTRNPRGGAIKAYNEKDIAAFSRLREELGMGELVAHAPYTLNACAKDKQLREFARNTMREDIARLENIARCFYNFHPGSHVGQGAEEGIRLIAEALNSVLTPEQRTIVLLETMAGKGSEVGGRFEELRAVIDRVELQEKVGVCLDTCHVWDGGYDIVGDLDGVLERFHNIIGLERLKAVHLNDSLNPCGSHKDRHAVLDGGEIGLEAIVRVINHPKLRHLPFCLETPNELEGYAREIELLRGKRKD